MTIKDLFAELKEQYLQEFPAKLIALKEALNAQDAKNLHVLFHRLKGTGKTYGFEDVSTVSQLLETSCLESVKTGSPLELQSIEKAIAILGRIYDCAQKKLPYSLATDADFLFLKDKFSP